MAQLDAMQAYLVARVGHVHAEREVVALVDWCAGLSIFPHRGTSRDDVLRGLRVTHHRGRTTIALRIDEANRRVAILGLYGRGRDVDAALRDTFA